MSRLIVLFFLLVFSSVYSRSFSVPENVRSEYASGMFEAFVTQSYGKSTIAFYQFDVAREKAKKAGENPLRLIAIERLFGWYRMYASSLGLYHRRPTGNDVIRGEYKRHYSRYFSNSVNHYQSELGNTPEKAKLMRDFMVGVGEVISGVFCAVVSDGLASFSAGTVAFDGLTRMYDSLSSLWAIHQAELIALKEWENSALKPAVSQ